ncbi:MAG: GAF domain-containing sensor histidine kinase [Anaerolineae bacterium]|nr:GAF domain-containing sensor histidine kinase [Anaerolineae bacterium]
MASGQTTPIFSNEAAFTNYLRLMARYERLMEISQQLNSTLDLGTLLSKIIRAAVELTETETASIMLLEPTSGELRFMASTQMSRGAMEAIIVPKEGSIAGWVAQTGVPMLVEDVQNHPLFYNGVDETVAFTTRNMLAVPMVAHNRVIGVVQAINKSEGIAWTDDDMNTLSALAAQAAIAVENARLFQQSDFISEMVHELRNPLVALKASTALLLRPDLPDQRRTGIIQTMQGEIERLSRLTTDFLDLARLESGRTRLESSVYRVRPLVDECVDIVRLQAAERSINFLVETDDNLELFSDRNKVKQVLLNLLTNAIKYNKDKGHIYITTAVLNHVGDSDQFARISVRDTGHGISDENKQHMFEKFYRSADHSSFTTGTGLGLVIAKRIVEAHGGEMGFDSALNVGTTFYFTLPVAEQNNGKG